MKVLRKEFKPHSNNFCVILTTLLMFMMLWLIKMTLVFSEKATISFLVENQKCQSSLDMNVLTITLSSFFKIHLIIEIENFGGILS